MEKQIRPLWLLLVIILAIVGAVLFFLTEDMSLTMKWVDIWTVVNALILLLEILGITLVFKRERERAGR